MNAAQKKFMGKARKNGLSVEEQISKMEAKASRDKARVKRAKAAKAKPKVVKKVSRAKIK